MKRLGVKKTINLPDGYHKKAAKDYQVLEKQSAMVSKLSRKIKDLHKELAPLAEKMEAEGNKPNQDKKTIATIAKLAETMQLKLKQIDNIENIMNDCLITSASNLSQTLQNYLNCKFSLLQNRSPEQMTNAEINNIDVILEDVIKIIHS